MSRRTMVAVVFLLLATATGALATPPIVAPGDCLYLVGAPSGAPLAATEERFAGTRIEDDCEALPHVGTDESGPNSAQAAIAGRRLGTSDSCQVRAFIGHEFTVGSAPSALEGAVDVAGVLMADLTRNTASLTTGAHATVMVELLEVGDTTVEGTRVAHATVFDAELTAKRLVVDQPFAQRLSARLRPDTTYRVRLEVILKEVGQQSVLDFGALGSGNGARYDSIEVCLEAPPDDTDLRADVAALAALDLERQLYARECLPTIWLPAARGGRLEEARALAADLLARSVASNDPGVNQRVAEARLVQADAAIIAGEFQRACRSLSEVVRALTTP